MLMDKHYLVHNGEREEAWRGEEKGVEDVRRWREGCGLDGGTPSNL